MAILLLIMIFVVPKFEQVFKQLPGLGELPALTQALQAFSNFLLEKWYILLLIIVAILQNTSPVAIRFLGWETQSSLVVVLLATLAAGLAIGGTGGLWLAVRRSSSA